MVDDLVVEWPPVSCVSRLLQIRQIPVLLVAARSDLPETGVRLPGAPCLQTPLGLQHVAARLSLHKHV